MSRLAIAPASALALVASALLAACGPRVPAAPRPAPTPTPAPSSVGPVAPIDTALPTITEVPTPVPDGRAAWAFAYMPGFVVYHVDTRAEISVEGDSVVPGRDSATTHVRVSFRISPENAPRGVAATVDSFLVRPRMGDSLISALATPLVFSATLDEGRSRLVFPAEQVMLGAPCAGPGLTLLALARDLVPPMPTVLERGARWRDSTSHTLCRAGVPLVVVALHEWSVEGEAEQDGMRWIHLRRLTQATVSGTGEGRRAGASVAGTSRVTADYLVDPVGGRVHRLTAESEGELQIRERPDGPVTTTRQRARQEAARAGG